MTEITTEYLESLTKEELLELKEIFKNKVIQNNNNQMARKILLNSAYGALSNVYFRFFSIDLAEAVTMSGQVVIIYIGKRVNAFLNKILKTDEDYVVASDTDSMYIRLEKIVSYLCGGEEKTINEKINLMDKFCNKILVPKIKEYFEEFAKNTHAFSNKMEMKREMLASRGIWTAKKRYVLNVYDKEGVRYEQPKLKISGLEAIKSSTPSSCRENIKKAISIIMNESEEKLQHFIKQYKKDFVKLPIYEISFPKSCNGIKKYTENNILAKGTPIHVRGAFVFNSFISNNNLEKTYPLIQEGEKIKYCYLKTPNHFRQNVISFQNVIPKEMNLERYIDYDMQFEKGFLDPLNVILGKIAWNPEKVNNLNEIFSLFNLQGRS